MANAITPIPAQVPIVEHGGTQSQEMRSLLLALADRALIIGEGSPDGQVSANQGAIYMDSLGATGSILYIKRDSDISNDRSLGWVLV